MVARDRISENNNMLIIYLIICLKMTHKHIIIYTSVVPGFYFYFGHLFYSLNIIFLTILRSFTREKLK